MELLLHRHYIVNMNKHAHEKEGERPLSNHNVRGARAAKIQVRTSEENWTKN